MKKIVIALVVFLALCASVAIYAAACVDGNGTRFCGNSCSSSGGGCSCTGECSAGELKWVAARGGDGGMAELQ